MINKMFKEFNELYGLETKEIDHNLPAMHDLIEDERKELGDEIFDVQDGHYVSCEDVVKEAIDIIYITCQQLTERGVDVEAALNEVHRSNMSKLPHEPEVDNELEIAKIRYPSAYITSAGGWSVIKCRDTNKVIKPTTYSPAVITPDMWNKK